MVSIYLIQGEAGDPSWMGGSSEPSKMLEQASEISTGFEALGMNAIWALLLLIFFKLAPTIGDILNREHEYNIDRRRAVDGKGDESDASETAE